MNNYKIKIINVAFIYLFLLIFLISKQCYAEELKMNDYTQVDFMENISEGRFGSVEHSVEYLDHILTQNNKTISYLVVRDDTVHRNYIIVTDENGNELKRIYLGSSYSVFGNFYELKDKSGILLFTGYNSSCKYADIIYLDNDGNKLGEYISSNMSRDIGSNRVVAEDNTYVYYAVDSSSYQIYFHLIKKSDLANKVLSVTLKTYSPTSANDDYRFYTDGEKVYVLYDQYKKNRNNYYYLYPYGSGMTDMGASKSQSYSIWPYYSTNVISNVKIVDEYILIYSDDIYAYNIKDKTLCLYNELPTDTLSKIGSDKILTNNEYLNFKTEFAYEVQLFNDKKLNIENRVKTNELIINYEEEKITLDNNITNSSFKVNENFVVLKLDSTYVIFTDEGKILTYYSDVECTIDSIDDYFMVLYNKSLYKNYFKIQKESNKKFEITRINDKDINEYNNVIFCGENGLTIEGEVYSDCSMKLKIGNDYRDIDISDNKFQVHVEASELVEGIYEDVYIVVDENKDNVYLDEIALGKDIYYDDVLYTKIDSTLLYEKYPTTNYTSTRNAILSLSEEERNGFLNDSELDKYSPYIYDEGKYAYWLSSCNVGSQKNIITLSSKNKNYEAYPRYKKEIKLNEKFRLNPIDNVYYHISEFDDNSFALGRKLYVSFSKLDEPNVEFQPDTYMNSNDIKLIAHDTLNEDESIIIEVDYNGENKIIEIDKNKFNNGESYEEIFEDSGSYTFTIYTSNVYGNESKRKSIKKIIDKDAPKVLDVYYKDAYLYNDTYYANSDEVTAIIKVYDISNVGGKYIGDNIYEIEVPIKYNEEKDVEIIDECNNTITCHLKGNFVIDTKNPIIEKINVNYYNDYCTVDVIAKDDVGIKDVYYKIDDKNMLGSYEKLNVKLKLYFKDYTGNAKIYFYTTDYANNLSEVKEESINLNDKPNAEISKINLNFDMGNLPKVQALVSDIDKDELEVQIALNDLILLSNKYSDGDTVIFNGEDYFNVFESLDYDKKYSFAISVNDGFEKIEKKDEIIKVNMKPSIMIESNNLNFKNFSEINIKVFDIDKDVYENKKLKLYVNDKLYYDGICKNGDNKFTINNYLKYYENNIKAVVYDNDYKVTANKMMNVKEDVIVTPYDLFFVKIEEDYSDEFINYIFDYYKKARLIVLYGVETKGISKDELYEKIKNNESKFVVNEVLYSDDFDNIVSLLDDDKIIYMTCDDTFEAKDIKLIDIEKDYSNALQLEGKERTIETCYNHLSFENTRDDFELKCNLYDEDNRDNFKLNLLNAGLYEIKLNEKDYIYYEDTDYSKSANEKIVRIFAHNKPYIDLKCHKIEEDSNKLKIKIEKEIYDKDFYSFNKGVSKLKVIIEEKENGIINKIENDYYESEIFDPLELDLDKNKEYTITCICYDFGMDPNTMEYVLSNEAVIRIMDEPMTPVAMFEYTLDENHTIFSNNYIYSFDETEDFYIDEYIDYKDMLKGDGSDEKKYIYEKEDIIEMAKDINDIEIITNELYVKNKYDKTTSYLKDLEIRKIKLFNNTILNYDKEDGFSKVNDLNIDVQLLNQKYNDDIKIVIDDNFIMNEYKLGHYEYLVSSNYIQDKLNSKISDEEFNDLNFELKIYSNRNNSYLGKTDIVVRYYSNCSIVDFMISSVNDKNLKLSYPIDYINMPVGNIKKGYSFEYDILTKGMKDDDYKIMIDVDMLYADKNYNVKGKIQPQKINNKLIENYNLPIYYNDQVIGDLNHIELTNYNKIDLEENEMWKGNYYIPYDMITIVDNEIKKDGYIIINFNIKAYKDNNIVYNFNNEKWINGYGIFNGGDTAIYDNSKSLLDDISGYGLY